MSDTPRTDAAVNIVEFEPPVGVARLRSITYVSVEFARQLERELFNTKLELDCERGKLLIRTQELDRIRSR